MLHIITRLVVGGAQENTLLTAIAQHQNPHYDVELFAGIDDGPEGTLIAEADSASISVHLTPYLIRALDPRKDMLALAALVRYIRKGRYTIVHTHCAKAGILGRLAAWIVGVPIVVHTYHSLPFHDRETRLKNALYIALNRGCAPMTDHFITVCDHLQRRALAHRIGTPDRYTTVASGMHLERFLTIGDSVSPVQARQHFGIPAAAKVVGKIARLFPLKGHGLFFDAAKRIAEQHSDVWFLVVGDGILRDELEQRAAAEGIRDRTVFVGLVAPDAIPRCIQAMDVLVHTSLREGLPRVLPQAGAVGKPVVTFDMDGAPECVDHGRSGYLCPPGDSAAVARWTNRLLDDPERCVRFGAYGRIRAQKGWGVRGMVERIDKVYNDVLCAQSK